jgi:hypothetical protein
MYASNQRQGILIIRSTTSSTPLPSPRMQKTLFPDGEACPGQPQFLGVLFTLDHFSLQQDKEVILKGLVVRRSLVHNPGE